MSYIIRKTNGQTLGTILDGTVDTAQTSLTLVGRNYANYGQIMTDNLVKLVENFAYNIAPSNPLPGQLWWDSGTNLLKVYSGTQFKVVGSAAATAIAPVTTLAGDLWWDTSNEQFYVYNGTAPYALSGWILVGPTWSKIKGKSGALWETVLDTTSTTHSILVMYLDGTRTGIISQDTAFTPATAIPGFTSILPGYNMASFGTFNGTAFNSSRLGGVAAANYLRTDTNNTTTGNLHVVNDAGVTIGASRDFEFSVNDQTGFINNLTDGGSISVNVTSSSVNKRALFVNGLTGLVEVYGDPTLALGVATKQYVDNSFVNSTLTGIPVAPTAPFGTANTQVATTEFVVNNSGFLKNKIYEDTSYMEITDTGVGAATLVVDGTTVLTATASGVNLNNGATAVTQSQTYLSTGDSKVATTNYVRTASQWWGGSAKFVSSSAPVAGVNDIGSVNGDFWFQYTV